MMFPCALYVLFPCALYVLFPFALYVLEDGATMSPRQGFRMIMY